MFMSSSLEPATTSIARDADQNRPRPRNGYKHSLAQIAVRSSTLTMPSFAPASIRERRPMADRMRGGARVPAPAKHACTLAIVMPVAVISVASCDGRLFSCRSKLDATSEGPRWETSLERVQYLRSSPSEIARVARCDSEIVLKRSGSDH